MDIRLVVTHEDEYTFQGRCWDEPDFRGVLDGGELIKAVAIAETSWSKWGPYAKCFVEGESRQTSDPYYISMVLWKTI